METKLINFWWRDLPVAASRVSGFLSVILADGIYLTHWSKVAAYAPVVSLVLGLLIGWFHFAPGQTFTFSIGVMALLMTISSAIADLVGWVDNGNPTSSPYYSSCCVLGCTPFNPT
ncbi:MAG: hypothetical protein IM319_03090 [Microcystis sp. M113S1]|jgi:hypothetical protein|uniref:hypothetical protein n=1 Tax=Microcystis sp. M113S1 TaxID=2771104 RepID=UPI002590EFEE|nr:hypothetical protein [Microcystis sp. M113S1]MCA2938187.1 hypothetical protein [Microcystis sp. M113S1]